MKKAFTLVELAIVLVIIGFILSMGMKGTELIKSAKTQAEAYKFKKIDSGVAQFYNKYQVLPGDGCYANDNNVTSPEDGQIQLVESPLAFLQLEKTGFITSADEKIDGNYAMFVPITAVTLISGDSKNLDYLAGVDGTYYDNPNNATSSAQYGSGNYTGIILASQTHTVDSTVDENAVGKDIDLNGNTGDSINVTYRYIIHGTGDPGVNDAKAYALEIKVDGKPLDDQYSWNGQLRTLGLARFMHDYLYSSVSSSGYKARSSWKSDLNAYQSSYNSSRLMYSDKTTNYPYITYKVW